VGDIEQTRKETKRFIAVHKKRAALGDAYRAVFDSADGKKVLTDLCRAGHLLETTVALGDPYLTHVAEGKRIIILHILDMLRWTPNEVRALAEERTADQIAMAMGDE
jgi:hypothetical protein